MRGGGLASVKGLHTLSRALVPESLPPSSASSGPALANRLFLAGSDRPSCPQQVPLLSNEDVDCYRLVDDKDNKDEIPTAIASLVHHQLANKGALLVRGLAPILPTNAEFGRLASLLGPRCVTPSNIFTETSSIQVLSSRFHYNAGFASREEDPAAPGVMAAADDPPEVSPL